MRLTRNIDSLNHHRKIEEVASSPQQVTNMTEIMIGSEAFIALVAKFGKKEVEKAEHAEFKSEIRRRKFVEADYSTGARSVA